MKEFDGDVADVLVQLSAFAEKFSFCQTDGPGIRGPDGMPCCNTFSLVACAVR